MYNFAADNHNADINVKRFFDGMTYPIPTQQHRTDQADKYAKVKFD